MPRRTATLRALDLQCAAGSMTASPTQGATMHSIFRQTVIVAFLLMGWLPAHAEQVGSGDGGGLGLLVLIGLLVWLAGGTRKHEAVRCPICRFRAPRRQFSGSCGPVVVRMRRCSGRAAGASPLLALALSKGASFRPGRGQVADLHASTL
jgi:hypothetical protein